MRARGAGARRRGFAARLGRLGPVATTAVRGCAMMSRGLAARGRCSAARRRGLFRLRISDSRLNSPCLSRWAETRSPSMRTSLTSACREARSTCPIVALICFHATGVSFLPGPRKSKVSSAKSAGSACTLNLAAAKSVRTFACALSLPEARWAAITDCAKPCSAGRSSCSSAISVVTREPVRSSAPLTAIVPAADLRAEVERRRSFSAKLKFAEVDMDCFERYPYRRRDGVVGQFHRAVHHLERVQR